LLLLFGTGVKRREARRESGFATHSIVFEEKRGGRRKPANRFARGRQRMEAIITEREKGKRIFGKRRGLWLLGRHIRKGEKKKKRGKKGKRRRAGNLFLPRCSRTLLERERGGGRRTLTLRGRGKRKKGRGGEKKIWPCGR